MILFCFVFVSVACQDFSDFSTMNMCYLCNFETFFSIIGIILMEYLTKAS